MIRIANLVCIMCASAALPLMATAQQQAEMTRVQVPGTIPVDVACPDVFQALPESLSVAWPVIGAPREVQVVFKLDGDRAHDVKIFGGHGDNYSALRKAVQALKCRSPGEGSYAVRFRVRFVDFPE